MSVIVPPYLAVITDKRDHFFASTLASKKPDDDAAKQGTAGVGIKPVALQAPEAVDYVYVDKHLFWIEQEYNHLTAILDDLEKKPSCIMSQDTIAKRDEERQQVRARCHYFAQQLIVRARVYHGPHSTEAQKYQKKINELMGEKPPSDDPTYMNTAMLRDWLGFLNVYRLHIVFSRLTWKQIWLLGRAFNWLDKSDKLGGVLPINIGMMDAPTAVFNVLSITFFASRFMVNFAMILKHTVAPEGEEENVPRAERFWREVKKRHWIMVNDLIWAIVNGLTNYAFYFNILSSTAGWILAAFLVFDLLWLVYRVYLEEQNYFSMKERYDHELSLITDESSIDWILLKKQLLQLSNNRYETNSTLYFAMGAAFLIMASFAAALLITSPLALPICFFFCTVAVSMYMSSGKFGTYMKERMICNRDQTDPKAQSEALSNFVWTMVKSTLMPLIIIGLFTISWQAAIVMTVLYIGYELSNGIKAAPEEVKSTAAASTADRNQLMLFKSNKPVTQDETQEITQEIHAA
ncbi:hypothetical protein N9Q05_00260 [bacterium]|nr:hypothetical protein [bacterium]